MMTHDTPIECTVHWRADGQEEQRDLILRDRPLDQLIAGLVERLGLREHVEGPTQCVAELRPSPDAPPLPDDVTLGEAEVRDGDHLWLVLTPTFLPVTVHWSAAGRTGEHKVVLTAARPVSVQVATLVEALGLRELVDGLTRSLAALRAAPDGPALVETSTLLDLDLRAGAQLWLTLAPRYMPVTLHWGEGGQELQKQRYIAVGKTVNEHLDDLVGLLGLEDQVGGPAKCQPSLRPGPSRPPLAPAQTLPEAGVRDGDDLWLVLTSTYVAVTVHYPAGDTMTSRRLLAPCTRPLQEVGPELARQLDLDAPGGVTLHPTVDGRAWLSHSTLADQGVREGQEIWLKLAPTVVHLPRYLTIGGGIAIALLVVILAGLALQMGPAVVAAFDPTPTLTPSPTPPPTATSVPPTPTPQPEQDTGYLRGLQALAQEPPDYPTAAESFEDALTRHPGSPPIVAILTQTYRRWAESSLGTPCTSEGPRALLQRALSHTPDDAPTLDLSQRLELYCAALASGEQQDWPATITSLEALRALQPDFLDSAQRIYDAYIAQSIAHKRQNDVDGALKLCQQAAAVPGVDTSAAQACVADPRPRLRFVKLDEGGDPTCVSVRVEGIDTAGWLLSIDGLRLRAEFDPAGNATACGLRARREVTFTVRDAEGQVVLGGGGVQARGSARMLATWP
ncbi:MAG: hypothetical protein HGA45_26680 [Chloroflexales bacterium]|nr:hypothetical protein [Chloroflexales bacterium]